MTHDELLALLNERDIGCGKNCQSAYGSLRAVVELHKTGNGEASRCEACYMGFDCPTIQVIEKVLL